MKGKVSEGLTDRTREERKLPAALQVSNCRFTQSHQEKLYAKTYGGKSLVASSQTHTVCSGFEVKTGDAQEKRYVVPRSLLLSLKKKACL